MLLMVALLLVLSWKYIANKNKSIPRDTKINTNQESIQEKSTENSNTVPIPPEPIKKTIIRGAREKYEFPTGAETSFDRSGNLTGGAFLNQLSIGVSASFIGRDLYILQQINAVIGLEVDPNASSILFPTSLRFQTDHDNIVNVTGWQCGGAYMSDRDSYLLYALTQVRRGQDPTSTPFAFSGKLKADEDRAENYTEGKCHDVEGVTLEGRDRFLLETINQFSFVEKSLE